MKRHNQIFFLTLLCCCVLCLCAGDAYAADVLQTVRDKAAKFIRDLRPLIFILAGFGLIGFAFAAIFGKISWKWFANIAIGLFLVANVGLFVDYFATRSGAAGQYAQDLGYGTYLDASGGYTPSDGSSGGPQPQNPPNGDNGGRTDNSNSEELGDNCVPGTGTGCEGNTGNGTGTGNGAETGNGTGTGTGNGTGTGTGNGTENGNGTGTGTGTETENGTGVENETGSRTESGSEQLANTKESCQAQGGVWLGNECMLPEEENPNEEPLPGTGFENDAAACQAQGGYWLQNTCITLPEETPDEEPLPGTGFENAAACQAQGGMWTGTECVLPEEETPDETPLPGTGFENEYDVDGGELDEVVVEGQDYTKEIQSCTLKGGKWNSSKKSCEYDELNSPIDSPNINNGGGVDMPSGEQMNSLAQKAREQYDTTGKIDMNQLLREEVAAGRMTEEQAARAGAIFTDVANSKGGNVSAAIDDVLKGSKEQMEEEKSQK